MAQSLWICPFKAHKGKPVEEIPRGYLEWLLAQDFFCDPANGNDRAIKAIQTELAYRERHGELDEDRKRSSKVCSNSDGNDDDDDEEDLSWNRRSRR